MGGRFSNLLQNFKENAEAFPILADMVQNHECEFLEPLKISIKALKKKTVEPEVSDDSQLPDGVEIVESNAPRVKRRGPKSLRASKRATTQKTQKKLSLKKKPAAKVSKREKQKPLKMEHWNLKWKFLLKPIILILTDLFKQATLHLYGVMTKIPGNGRQKEMSLSKMKVEN